MQCNITKCDLINVLATDIVALHLRGWSSVENYLLSLRAKPKGKT